MRTGIIPKSSHRCVSKNFQLVEPVTDEELDIEYTVCLLTVDETDLAVYCSDLQSQITKQRHRSKYFATVVPYQLYSDDAIGFNHGLQQVLVQNSGCELVLLSPMVDSLTYLNSLIVTNHASERVSIGLYLSEPVPRLNYSVLKPSIVVLADSLFKLNSKNYPIFISSSLRTAFDTVCHRDTISFVHESGNWERKLSYVRFLHKQQRFNPPILIDPLQPLRDDLDESVYRLFEQDRTKYRQYELAVKQALREHDISRIVVVGPGYNGPLVSIVVNACRDHSRNFDIVMVEKNAKCWPSLQYKVEREWPHVKLIKGDVRHLHNLERYQLVVSELLGSIGCNELSPDILTRFNRAVMIPNSYRSYVCPIYEAFLNESIVHRPYLIKPSCRDYHQTGPWQPLFEFDHPGTQPLNQCVSVDLGDGVPVSGFMGVFTSQLYKSIRIGIHPRLCDVNEYCHSWYPMIFPVDYTIAKSKGTFKRVNDGTRVWYEWMVGERRYNADGVDYQVDLI